MSNENITQGWLELQSFLLYEDLLTGWRTIDLEKRLKKRKQGIFFVILKAILWQ